MPIRIFSASNFLVIALLLPALLAPLAGGAAEWTAEPSIKLRREYNDNLRLSIYPHESVAGSLITPALDLAGAGPNWKIGFGGEATQRRYSGQEGLDRDDSSLKLNTLHRTERSTWQLDASRTRDSVVTNEQADADTGAVQSSKDRETDSLAPTWTWLFSQRTRLQLAYQQTDVAYDQNSLSTGLYDYRYRTFSTTVSNLFSERDQIFIYGGYSKFHVPITDFDSETLSLQAGFTRNLTETTTATLQAGRRRTESFTRGGAPIYSYYSDSTGIYRILTGVTQDTRTQRTSSVFTGNLESKYESSDLSLSLSRSLDPSGSGGQVEQDQFNLKFNKHLSPRLGINLYGSATKLRTQEGNISNSDRTFYDFAPGGYWQWTREWSIGANYRYAHVKRVYENEAADSNSLNLWLTYRPLKMSVSR